MNTHFEMKHEELKFSEMRGRQKIFDYDFHDLIPCNACFLEILWITDFRRKRKATVFMGTFDGHLHSLRLETEVKG